MSNGIHSSSGFRSRRPDSWYFDRLPPTARKALANAAFEWASGWFYTRWKRGKHGFQTGPDIAARVAEWDARWIVSERQQIASKRKRRRRDG
jgi:hypothetical protein